MQSNFPIPTEAKQGPLHKQSISQPSFLKTDVIDGEVSVEFES